MFTVTDFGDAAEVDQRDHDDEEERHRRIRYGDELL
jgi:hypothetical protein